MNELINWLTRLLEYCIIIVEKYYTCSIFVAPSITNVPLHDLDVD